MIAVSYSPVNIVKAKQPGQLLHMDTVGPSRLRSIGGKWYVLVIVDDYSHYSWVYFWKVRMKCLSTFQSLALRFNNEHPNCLKIIHSDNGTEFKNVSFNQFCHDHGVDLQFSAPRVTQQNKVVKRKNRTIVEMAMTMLNENRTRRHFCADAINTACYISNRIFLRLILNLTPFELRFGRMSSVSHLMPFDCKCFVLKRSDLDKFGSRSSMTSCLDIPLMADLIVFNL
jgi:hypothetical protein